jgi:hypothetical protein
MKYLCIYFIFRSDMHDAIIDHLVNGHAHGELSFRELSVSESTGRLGYTRQTCDGVVPSTIQHDGILVTVVGGNVILDIAQSESTPQSMKMSKAETPSKTEQIGIRRSFQFSDRGCEMDDQTYAIEDMDMEMSNFLGVHLMRNRWTLTSRN